MRRMHALLGLLASVALAATTAGPAVAEPLPSTLSIQTAVSHYMGGWWEQEASYNVTCDGYGPQEIWVDLPGSTGDVLPQIGPVTTGASCVLEVGYHPEPGDGAGWELQLVSPSDHFTLEPGANTITVTWQRAWLGDWPPEEDTASEHLLQLEVDRIYLNSKGGIEVEGTSWCPDAAAIVSADSDVALYAGAQWDATQYVGRRTTLHAAWESGIAHPCWEAAASDHGPYRWQTRYAYPSGALQYVYAWDGKFGAGSIHVEARAQTELVDIAQSFAPDGWTSFEGDLVRYDADCVDVQGDGWCVTRHLWFGWDGADLKPIKVR